MDKRITSDIKMIKVFVVLLLIVSLDASAITFKSKVLSEEAELKGSWGDPKFKIAAKNFPKSSLEKDQTLMEMETL